MPKQREIKQELIFKKEGTFESLYAAEKHLRDNGYSYGSLDAPFNPVGIRHGEYDLPEKWHNFNAKEKKSVDGIITSDDWREGEVKVTLYK